MQFRGDHSICVCSSWCRPAPLLTKGVGWSIRTEKKSECSMKCSPSSYFFFIHLIKEISSFHQLGCSVFLTELCKMFQIFNNKKMEADLEKRILWTGAWMWLPPPQFSAGRGQSRSEYRTWYSDDWEVLTIRHFIPASWRTELRSALRLEAATPQPSPTHLTSSPSFSLHTSNH